MLRFIIICSVAWLVFSSRACAQNISEYRYWWDDDVSTLVTTSVDPNQLVNIDVSIATSSLDNGHHTLTVQFKDDNDIWSVPYTQIIYQNGDLIEYEYWFDDDIAASTLMSTPQTSVQTVNTAIDVSSLSPGLHKITIRSLSNTGESSVPYTAYFKNSGGDLVSWQYWFDDDVSTTIDESIAPPQNMLDLIEDLDVSNLSAGPHTVTWRCEDATSNWSVPITYAFDVLVGLEDIVGLESVLIYPSPAKSQLSIRVETSSNVQLDVEILNPNGQIVSANHGSLSSQKDMMSLDVSNLASGVYFVKLSDSDRFVTHRFVKQ